MKYLGYISNHEFWGHSRSYLKLGLEGHFSFCILLFLLEQLGVSVGTTSRVTISNNFF